MKSLILLAAVALMSSGCDSERRVSLDRLPAAAQELLETYYTGRKPVEILRDRDDGRMEYEVKLADGSELTFDAEGEWTSIEGDYSFVPLPLVPQPVRDDLARRYADARVTSIERERGGYEVTVVASADPRPVKLRYSAAGAFAGYDR